jgi:hypothetical protein
MGSLCLKPEKKDRLKAHSLSHPSQRKGIVLEFDWPPIVKTDRKSVDETGR